MKEYKFRKKIISVLTAFLMLSGSITGAVPLYAAQDSVSGDFSYINETEVQLSENAAQSEEETGEDSVSPGSTEASGNETVSGENPGNDSVSEDNAEIAEDTVSSDETQDYVNQTASQNVIAVNMPLGVRDDETEIENPEPLPKFITDVTQQNKPGGLTTLNKGSSGADFASAYSSSDMGYLPESGLIDQGNSFLCWAFSSTMLAAISMIRKGLADRSFVRYSPDQVGYFFYNRINDPLGNTAGDKNLIKDGSKTYYDLGGNNSYNTWSLASWISMRNFADVPFRNSKYDSLPDDKAYSSTAHLQNAYWASTYTEDPQNIDYIENVKELIYDHGGVSALISNQLYINENHAVYTPEGGGGHNVTLVGWDDSYPKENFYTAPPGNGAWYVRDSYDESEGRDDNGCFWISYYSRDITDGRSDKAIAFDFESGDNYDNNYQYDGAAGSDYLPSGAESVRMSSVFRAKGDEYLEAVAFAPASTSMSYEINIYKLSENFATPVGDVSLSRATGETRYVGYRTVKLDRSVALSENDLFSVVVDVRDTSGKNNAMLYVDNKNDKSSWVEFRSGVSANQSFYEDTDLAYYGFCARIKAFTDNAGSGPEKPEKKTAALARFTAGDYSYDGTLHCPSVSVNKGEDGSGELLNAGTDYTVACYNNKYAGEATAVIYSDKYRINNSSYTFTIRPKTLDDSITAELVPNSFIYDGTEKKPSYTISDNALQTGLKEGVDFTAAFEGGTEAGTAAIVVTGIGNYTGEKRFEYTIAPLSIGDFEFSTPQDTVYNGEPQTPAVTVTDQAGNQLVVGRDYTTTGYDNVNSGIAKVKITGKGNYTGTKTLSYNILPKSIAGASVAGVSSTYQYTGDDIKPEPEVADPDTGGKKLEKGIDYTVEYRNNREEGNAFVTIRGIGNYTGQKDTLFFISKAKPLQITIAAIPDQTYIPGGVSIKPVLKVKHGSDVLNSGSDYITSYADNINAGTAKARITGVSKTIYDNSSAVRSFTIKRFDLKNATAGGISDQFYVSGKTYTVSPTVTVKNPVTRQAVTLKEGEDFKLSYENNTAHKKGQKVTVYIDGINNYTGRIKKSFILRSYVPMGDTESFEISLSQYEYNYDGTAKKPQVKVCYRPGNAVLREGADYKVTYKSNKNAGNAKVTVKPTKSFTGSYNVKGSAEVFFTIRGKTPKNLTFADISDKTYKGKQIKPKITVYENGKKLSSSYYYVEYADNVNAGKGRFTVYGKKNYSGELGTGTFVIKKRKFSKVKTSYKKSSGVLTVKYGNAVLRENIDFTKNTSARLLTSLETNFEAGTKKY
ncbi:MAG: hypothetical protein K5985_03285 [Lachnospiraceae bacterium]|nr:hypothetical protein [Lachnospiraceae bacterium]